MENNNTQQEAPSSSQGVYILLGIIFAIPPVLIWVSLGLETLNLDFSNSLFNPEIFLENSILNGLFFILFPIITLAMGVVSKGRGRDDILSNVLVNLGIGLLLLNILSIFL